MGRLEDKVVLITGAASGFGRDSAVRFAKEGAKVVVADLIEKPLQGGFESDLQRATAQVITDDGGAAVYVPCDVTKAEVSRPQSGRLSNTTVGWT